MKLLLTAVGKRIQLIEQLKKQFVVIGVDAGVEVAAKFFLDGFYQVPGYTEQNYVERLIEICKIEQIDCLIPLYEKEFNLIEQYRQDLKNVGTELLLSSKKIIQICNEKEATSEFFEEHHIVHPKMYNLAEEVKLPAIIKPADGMGSQNIFKITTRNELEFFMNYVPNPIIEEFIDGKEYTVDILCDMKGKPIYIVPRLRIEVRGGEVSKSQIVLDNEIIQATEYVLECLNKYKNEEGIGVVGPMTIQCFKQQNGHIVFLEINPRFGGGVPLSIEAGADYAKCIKEMLQGGNIERQHNVKPLKMLRFDQAIFLE